MKARVKAAGRIAARILTSSSITRNVLRRATRHGVVPRSIWMRLPVSGSVFVDVPEGKPFEYVSSPNDVIGRALFWKGVFGWEPETTTVFCRLAKDSKVFFDVGANTGLFSLLALSMNPQIRVVSFEPVPAVYDRLRDHLERNNYTERCTVRQAAVSDSPGMASFHIPDSDLPYSASLDPHGYLGISGSVVDVEVTTVDVEARHFGIPDMMKIDVEGFEDKVLEGMGHTFAKTRPTIILECNSDGPKEKIAKILDQFKYCYYHLQDSPVPVSTINPDPQRKYKNFLCIIE